MAIISDIHANAVALSAVLAVIAGEGVDSIVCLGDVASDGPQPRETLDLIRRLGCQTIMGNADAQLLGLEPELADPALQIFNEASRWCAGMLDADDRALLSSFAPRLDLDIEGVPVLLFHGSPGNFNDEIYPTTPDEVLRPWLAGHTAALHVGGHTHFQMLRRIDKAMFLNPGSVGMAYDRTRGAAGRISFAAWAEFAIVDFGAPGWAISLRRIPFEVQALIEAFRATGRPNADWWIKAWDRAARL